MEVQLDELFREGGKVLLANYMQTNLLVYDGFSLWLLYSWKITDKTIECKRCFKLELCPRPPSDYSFDYLIVNSIGTRIALISSTSAFVVEAPSEICGRCLEELRDLVEPIYYCRCKPVANSLHLSRYAPKIIKAIWYPKRKVGNYVNSSVIALLYSDSTVRIFNLTDSFDTPLIIFDFRTDKDESFPKGLGLHNSIVSFDFGPCIQCENDGDIINIIFAIDNDCKGIYMGIFNGRSSRMLGPFQIDLSFIEDKFDYEPCYLLCLCDWSNESFVFALAFNDGTIAHICLVIDDVIDLNTSLNVQFFLSNFFTLPSSFKTYSLLSVSWNIAAYLAFDGLNVFLIYLSDKVVDSGIQHHPSYTIDHIVCCLANESTILSTAALYFIDESRIFSSSNFHSFLSNRIVVMHTDGKEIKSKIVTTGRRNICCSYKKDLELQKNTDSSVVQLMDQCERLSVNRISVPQIKFNDSMLEPQMLLVAESVISSLTNNLENMGEIHVVVRKTIGEMLERIAKMDYDKAVYNERLLRLVAEFSDIKNRLCCIQNRIDISMKKANQIIAGLIPSSVSLNEPEKTMLKRLNKIADELSEITVQLPHIVAALAVMRHKRFGFTRSFCASIGARKFVLSKNTSDLEEMKNWVNQLSRRLDRLNVENVFSTRILSELQKKNI